MGYQVELLNFEGPMHLLLQLIEQEQLDITEVALAQVTRQYLEYMAKLSDLGPEEINQFIGLAARLIHIKSQTLLPTPPSPEYESDLEDLTRQLEEYRQYQSASKYLHKLMTDGNASWSREAAPGINSDSIPMPGVSIQELQGVFTEVMRRLPRPVRQELEAQISLEEAVDQLRLAIGQSAGDVKLSRLLATATSRTQAVVLFLGLLELLRLGEIAARQDRIFGDIILIDG